MLRRFTLRDFELIRHEIAAICLSSSLSLPADHSPNDDIVPLSGPALTQFLTLLPEDMKQMPSLSARQPSETNFQVSTRFPILAPRVAEGIAPKWALDSVREALEFIKIEWSIWRSKGGWHFLKFDIIGTAKITEQLLKTFESHFRGDWDKLALDFFRAEFMIIDQGVGKAYAAALLGYSQETTSEQGPRRTIRVRAEVDNSHL